MSVIPPSLSEKCHSSPVMLQAVNESSIKTYGEKSIALDWGLPPDLRWICGCTNRDPWS